MFNDNSLLPKEAVRLAALGMVCEHPKRYAELANAVRDFTSRIVGPSLDLLGSSIELLKTEGLIAGEDDDEHAPLRDHRGRAGASPRPAAERRPPAQLRCRPARLRPQDTVSASPAGGRAADPDRPDDRDLRGGDRPSRRPRARRSHGPRPFRRLAAPRHGYRPQRAGTGSNRFARLFSEEAAVQSKCWPPVTKTSVPVT